MCYVTSCTYTVRSYILCVCVSDVSFSQLKLTIHSHTRAHTRCDLVAMCFLYTKMEYLEHREESLVVCVCVCLVQTLTMGY